MRYVSKVWQASTIQMTLSIVICNTSNYMTFYVCKTPQISPILYCCFLEETESQTVERLHC